ncbi:MAG: cyclopropane-fatty-acyl-phospholipid synthase family protein [Pseudomonadota bacterium]
MWSKLFDAFLTHLFREGELSVTYPDGKTRRYGDGGLPSVAIKLTDPDLPRRIAFSPKLAAGEAYMDGTLVIENDDLRGFLELSVRNLERQGDTWFQRPLSAFRQITRPLQQFNPAQRARANVAHHYDLSGELYDLFLDEDRQYSCAYFARPDMSLEDAQAAKKRHIARKLRIEPGMRVLDIGCGWGGMGLTLARDYGADVVGVTLSEEQHARANARAEDAGMSDRAQFRLMDYREVEGTFDRIVSVGMFEHVGLPHYTEFFRTLKNRLSDDGIALLHTIGRCEPPAPTSPWILKYIFPGGYCPSMSEMLRATEAQLLWTTDIEIWRLHYAETLRNWHDRFTANIDKAQALYDDRFCRMWRFYLLACEMTFRYGQHAVFQFQLTKKVDAVPLTRDYLYPREDAELRHAAE